MLPDVILYQPLISNKVFRLGHAEASGGHDALGAVVVRSTSNGLALEVAEEASVGATESTRAAEAVELTVAAKRSGTSRARGRNTEELALVTLGVNGVLDVLEDVTLSEDRARVDLESVVRDIVEEVVDGVEESVAGDLGATAGNSVDVVVLEGDEIVGAGEVETPVVVVVAASRPAGGTINLAVGDGDTVAGVVSEDNVLTTDERSGNMVDPDVVSVVEGNGITTPDVLRVKLSDVNILDDDVLGTNDSETLTADDSLGANADQGLVGANLDTQNTGLVILDVDLGGVGLVVATPVVLIDGSLALGSGSPGSTTSLASGTLGADKVDGAVEVDNSGGGVAEVGDELSGGLGVDGSSVTSSCGGGTETFGAGGKSAEDGRESGGDREEGLEERRHVDIGSDSGSMLCVSEDCKKKPETQLLVV